MIKTSAQIIDAARQLSRGDKRRRVAVAVAQDADVIGAVQSAYSDGICDGSLLGDEKIIRELANQYSIPLDDLEIINQPNPEKAVMETVELAASGKADVIMKGFVSTAGLLKGVLDRRFNLRRSPTLSHVAVLDIPDYRKLLLMTDGGMMVRPTLEQRLDILKNGVLVARALGVDPVKVAVSAAVDTILPSMPQTEEAAKVAEMAQKQKIAGCIVAGPMSFDVAVSPEMAMKAGIDHPVAGDADVYVTGDIEECNITVKSMVIFGGAIFSGVIVGASVPVSLVSRTDPVIGKKTSIALACLVSDYYRRIGEGGQL